MELAERFNIPVVSFVDTAGAFPGRGAEERGQAEAIARSIDKGLSINVPFVSVIAGEGGSGGAVAIATADAVMMALPKQSPLIFLRPRENVFKIQQQRQCLPRRGRFRRHLEESFYSPEYLLNLRHNLRPHRLIQHL